ncbi:hypothetical protein GE061_001813 [Apolygus lucorum]|uniref:Uncharacterized protein n=1 Tax=Apolygus lucorum TaxID=248454 RepID=A0A8S9X3B7_APOLU|nr:hypothetical protein GE061_001813 [Apolygus lucorum]
MAPNKKAVEEKRQRKREYDRKRREKMKNDPELRREQQLKERLKYQKKLQKKQVNLVSDMTARERREFFIPKLRIATWNYSAPGHGKGAVDGVGGAMKRLLDKAVSCGLDISDFTSFVRILQEKSRNVSLYVISSEEIDGMASNIPKVIPGFKGTMKVYQVVYHRCDIPGSKKVLQMKRLSCCDCLNCDKFTLGNLVQDDIAPAISVEEQGEPSGILPEVIMETEIMEMDGHSESHAATIGEAVTTDEPQPGS